jgi:hypothetical protein
METEIETLLASTTPQRSEGKKHSHSFAILFHNFVVTDRKDFDIFVCVDLKNAIPHINIEKMYAHLRESLDEKSNVNATAENKTETAQEEFWREMEHSEDRFDTISRYFGKGIIP